MDSAAEVWRLVLAQLENELPSVAVQTWFDDAVAIEMTETSLVIYTPQKLKYNIITSRYTQQIQNILFNLFGVPLTLTVLSEEEMKRRNVTNPENKNIVPQNYTFDSFVVGSCNQFAFEASMAVTSQPGDIYNPLFIYGQSGLGKTHLLYAIANRMQITHPGLRICYVKGEQFTNDLVQSIGNRTMSQFRERYRECDLLLMDDVQFIAGMDRTQEEFFHTFNTLYEAKKQIVLTADRTPIEMKHLEERLCTRFQQGLIADIQPPDYETRIAITRNKAKSLNLDLPDAVVEYIAENITSNVRQLEGTIKKILAYQDLMHSKVDIDVVIRAVRDLIRERGEFEPSPDEIIEETAKFYGLDPREIKGPSRTKDINRTRQLSMYMIRRLTSLSLKEIGKVFSRDHTTVMHAIQRVDQMIDEGQDVAEVIKDITSNINAKNL